MKKFTLQLILVILISGLCGFWFGGYINNKINYRPFEFRGGIRHSGGDYVRSVSHVLINEESYDLEELYQEIYDEFILMNGNHNEITFYLYDSLEALHNSQHFSTKIYIKSSD